MTIAFFYSVDGGDSWFLNFIVPGGGPNDQSVCFASASNEMYMAILRGDIFQQLNELGTNDPTAVGTLPNFDSRRNIDQPWVEARTVFGGPDDGKDRLYISYNDDSQQQSASVVSASMH